MKNIAIILGLATATLLACEKEVGDTYDFSNSMAPYVELNTTVKGKTISVKEGKKFKVPLLIRTSMQENIDVNYAITGALAQQGTLRINRNAVSNASNADSILVPVGTVPTGSTTATATLTLVSAKDASNDTLMVGRLGKALEFMKLTISK